jgi:hypothetical protein
MVKKLKNIRTLPAYFFLLGAFLMTVSAQTDKRIDEIREIYQKTNRQIAESNERGEYSLVYLTELVVNKNNGSYPAVGIFRTVMRFYYTFGDREKNPYPDRLLKIEIETTRAARIEKYEFLFNDKGYLIFYFESKSEESGIEKRLYFQNEIPIKSLTGERTRDIKGAETKNTAKSALSVKKKLVLLFQNSLDY